MPGSVGENREYVVDIVREINPKRVLDVGAGQGTYVDLLRRHLPDATIEGMEVWETYVSQFNLHDKYDQLWIGDVRQLIPTGTFDLVIFGDVLEHMTFEEAQQVWASFSYISKWGMISVPIIHYPQGAEFGNPYEVHVQDYLSSDDIVREFGPFDHSKTWEITGTFFRKFK